jgi:hypothetical protein
MVGTGEIVGGGVAGIGKPQKPPPVGMDTQEPTSSHPLILVVSM